MFRKATYESLYALLNLMVFRRRPFRDYITVLAVVVAILMAQVFTSSERSYIYYFLNLQENIIGSADMVVVPRAQSSLLQSVFVNASLLRETFCANESAFQGCTPRWVLPAAVAQRNSTRDFPLIALIVNQSEEVRIGLDRKLPYYQLEGDEVVLSQSMLDEMNITVGERT